MMNQGSNAAVDPNSVENRHVANNGNPGQAVASYYPSTSGAEASAWPAQPDNASVNGVHTQTMYQHNQPTQPAGSSAPSLGTVNALQDYSSYTTYTNPADPYGYGTQGYQGYYNNYQQQPNQSYQQPVGTYQNTGAPYQPISSFQSTGSYAGSASYSSTYYNPADYQTAGGYASSGYTNPTNQTTAWNGGNYANYTPQQYAPYTPEAPGVYSSAPAASTPQNYQQQWADYYSQTEVSCAPGTENLSVTSTQNVGCPVPGVTTGNQTSVSQPLPPPPPLPSYAAPSWRPESISELPSVQSGSVVGGAQDMYWNNVVNTYQTQTQHITSNQTQFQRPLDQNSSYNSFQDQQKATTSQAPNVQYPHASQPPYVPHSYQTPSEAAPSIDAQRLNKLQIPTNPRITVGSRNTGKDINMASPAAKPAYISVSLPKPVDKVPSISSTNSLLKTGMFPKSLRGYVESALACCKDDNQMAASQVVLKQIITKATADSTLYTRDWDTEPLFPLPNEDDTNKQLNSSNLLSSLANLKRSPSRRAKSRWEPLLEEKTEKPAERPVSLNSGLNNAWGHVNDKDRKPFAWGRGSKNGNMSNAKFPSMEQKSASKIAHQLFKKQRLSDGVGTTENGDASSDSDPDQGSAAYYVGAMAFADSPEERNRREHRSKRFEKVQSHRGQNNHLKPKNAGAGNLYTRRTNALVLSKNFEDGISRAVEDIDWDSLTVKGTCQEIEKRYLRLTSAPDPATVRPEDVLENALLMVHNSPKNYLYKCDQLKSIRQDLTVQRIRNHLTVKVYETHARLALEVGDLPEYNQCQSQLKSLYADGIEGCHMEFSAYNLLCVILHSNNNRDLLSSMASLSDETKRHEAVKHALAVRGAVTTGNYVMFFRLYKTAPNLSTCIMDLYVEKMRFKAVSCMCRSYRPTIPVSYVAQILGFSTPNEESEEKDVEGLEECIEWLKLHGASLVADSNGEMQVDAKSTSSSLYMPETDAVSHGDPNLAVNDFFTRAPT